MYEGSSSNVDLILYYYHELWSEIHSEKDGFIDILNQILKKEGCGSANFCCHYKAINPNATEEEITKYVIKQWVKIGNFVNISID